MNVCVVGARGMLGTDLLRVFGSRRAMGFSRGEADITNVGALRDALRAIQPRTVINCAAYTKVDDCETHRELAFRVNGEGAGNVAAVCGEIGARLIHISTDYVFHGTATAPLTEAAEPNPLSVYGQSKLAGERAVLERLPEALVIRTGWLYGLHGPNFVETILRLAQEKNRLTIVNDQRGTPTYTLDLANAILGLYETDVTGLLHVANSGSCTWFEFAQAIVARARISGVKILPITSAVLGRPAPRPAYSVLDCSRYAAVAGAPLRAWPHALESYLTARQNVGAQSML